MLEGGSITYINKKHRPRTVRPLRASRKYLHLIMRPPKYQQKHRPYVKPLQASQKLLCFIILYSKYYQDHRLNTV